MNKAIIRMTLAVMVTGLLASGAFAAPVQLNDAQLDGVAAGGVEKVGGFVCPVLNPKVGNYNKNDHFFEIQNGEGGPTYLSIVPGAFSKKGKTISVPIGATNTLDDGSSGGPGGPFAVPGDKGYTAIWNTTP